MCETGGFYVGEFDPVGFVGEGFDVECVAKLFVRFALSFAFSFSLEEGGRSWK